jgi:hypothetical protein
MAVGNHGGDGANVNIDATDLQLTDPATGATLGPVIPSNQAFNVSMVFQLDGSFAGSIVTDPSVLVNISYLMDPRGGSLSGNTASTFTPAAGIVPITTLNGGTGPVYVFQAPDTTANVPAGSLAPGLYELSAVVTFPNANTSTPWPMSAFCDFEVIEIFTP